MKDCKHDKIALDDNVSEWEWKCKCGEYFYASDLIRIGYKLVKVDNEQANEIS